MGNRSRDFLVGCSSRIPLHASYVAVKAAIVKTIPDSFQPDEMKRCHTDP